MFCENCGKEILDESKFCKFCGIKVLETANNSEKEEIKSNTVGIWDKFAQIYDSKDAERKKILDLSSNEAWELINRLGKNSFESFIDENRDHLNKQPYKVIENLENTYKFAVIGGYWLWMAEYILKNNDSWKLKTIVFDNIIKDWTESVKEQGSFIENAPQDLGEAITTYHNFKVNSLLENCPTIKDLPTEIIEKMKLDLLIKILWGYFVGIAESKYITL